MCLFSELKLQAAGLRPGVSPLFQSWLTVVRTRWQSVHSKIKACGFRSPHRAFLFALEETGRCAVLFVFLCGRTVWKHRCNPFLSDYTLACVEKQGLKLCGSGGQSAGEALQPCSLQLSRRAKPSSSCLLIVTRTLAYFCLLPISFCLSYLPSVCVSAT